MSAPRLDHPGFAEPVRDAQACFRAVLDAMSRPGRIMAAGAELAPPPPLAPATAAVLLTLVDLDTPLWVDPACAAARDWIAFHCGAPLAAGPGTAAFVLAASLPDLDALRDGTDEAPEEGATVILQVAALGRGRALRLDGPGLREPGAFAAEGLPDEFPARWAANRLRFPRGIDLVLCAGNALAALPRSVRVKG